MATKLEGGGLTFFAAFLRDWDVFMWQNKNWNYEWKKLEEKKSNPLAPDFWTFRQNRHRFDRNWNWNRGDGSKNSGADADPDLNSFFFVLSWSCYSLNLPLIGTEYG